MGYNVYRRFLQGKQLKIQYSQPTIQTTNNLSSMVVITVIYCNKKYTITLYSYSERRDSCRCSTLSLSNLLLIEKQTNIKHYVVFVKYHLIRKCGHIKTKMLSLPDLLGSDRTASLHFSLSSWSELSKLQHHMGKAYLVLISLTEKQGYFEHLQGQEMEHHTTQRSCNPHCPYRQKISK